MSSLIRFSKILRGKWNINFYNEKQFGSGRGISSRVGVGMTCARPPHPSGARRLTLLSVQSTTSPKIGYRYFHSIDQTKRLAKVTIQSTNGDSSSLSAIDFENVAEETLESLCSYFDDLLEVSKLEDTDVQLGDGVLTIKLGQHGIYVINKQTPNKQIWLSSPTSGPKRYDFLSKTWIYKHDNMSMYQLLNSEIPDILQLPLVDFERNCTYGKSTESQY